MSSRLLMIAVSGLLAFAAGCSSSGGLSGSKVTGKVTDKSGSPIAGAKVIFTDGNAQGSLVSGPTAVTDENGEYAMVGVPPGSYKVVIYKLVPVKGAVLPPDEEMDLVQIEASGMGKHVLPKKYASPTTTTLVCQVPDGNSHEEHFQVK